VPEVDRVLATVLFTDIVDSTSQLAEVGDGRWRAKLDEHNRVVRSELDRWRGREVKNSGDGFLVTFDGPDRAVKCTAGIVDRVADLGLSVRAGLHTGECELLADDLAGMAVHIGARVMDCAGPGEVLASSTVKELVVGSDLRFVDRGVQVLKGVPDPWHLYALER
jgi:class 3 adenylate cyclase